VLFDDQSKLNWTIEGNPASFEFKNDMLILQQKDFTERHSFIRTKKKYTNFILELEAKREEGMNYGILFRAQIAPDTAHVSLYGYQTKIDHIKTRNWTAAIFDDFGNTWKWISTNENNIEAQYALKEPPEWGKYKIEVRGTHIIAWLNGIKRPTYKTKNIKKVTLP